jgi:hypothetical protein
MWELTSRAEQSLVMTMWTITFNPSDYPGKYVSRRSVIGSGWTEPTMDVFVADSIEEARANLPIGLMRFDRDPFDDPCIVESWL